MAEKQMKMFASHPMDREGFRNWLQNEAKIGDLILFHGEHTPIIKFNKTDSKTGEKWPCIKPSWRRCSLGCYGEHIIERVTGNKN